MNPLPWFHWDDRRQQEGIANPNPFFIVENNEFVFNQNFDWDFDWRGWQYRNPHDPGSPITN